MKKQIFIFMVLTFALSLFGARVSAEVPQKNEALKRAKNHAEEYQKLADSERKNAEEAAKKVPQDFWKETVRKSKELAEMYQKEADKFKKEAEELTKKVEEQKTPSQEPLKSEVPGKTAAPENPPANPAPPPAPKEEARKGSGEESESSGEIPVEEFIGTWKDEKSGEEVTIEPMYYGEKPELVRMRAKHLWSGRYENGKFTFKYTPKYDEMNSEVPEWARKKVEQEGKLIWVMELEPPQKCGELTLEGFWYPGEIEWKVPGEMDAAETSGREARATKEKGKPIPIRFRLQEDPDMMQHSEPLPLLFLRPADRVLESSDPEQRIAFMVQYEPYFVDVVVPKALAEKLGSSIEIGFKLARSGLTAKLTLPQFRESKGLVTYSLTTPIQLTRPAIEMRLPESLEKLLDPNAVKDIWPGATSKIIDGDDLEITYGNIGLKLNVYRTPTSQAVAQYKDGLRTLQKIFAAKLAEANTSREEKETAHLRVRLISNAMRVLDYKPQLTWPAIDPEEFSDDSKLSLATWYHTYVQTVISAHEKMPSKLGDRIQQPFGIIFLTEEERLNFELKKEQNKSGHAEFALKGLGQLSMNLYQITIANNPGGDFMAVVWGIDAMGNPVDKTDRFFIGLGMASKFLLFSAKTAEALKDLHTQGARSLRKESLPIASEETLAGSPSDGVSMMPAKIEDTTIRPWPGEKGFIAPVKVSPVGSQGTPIQFAPNTCGLNVVASIRRDIGMRFVNEENMMRISVQNQWYKLGEVTPQGLKKGGMNTLQMTKCLAAHGANAWWYRKVPRASEFSYWLNKNRKIVLKINVGTPQKPGWHWVRLEGIQCEGMKQFAVIGDPWNGNSWKVEMSMLRRRMGSSGGAVVADFPKK